MKIIYLLTLLVSAFFTHAMEEVADHEYLVPDRVLVDDYDDYAGTSKEENSEEGDDSVAKSESLPFILSYNFIVRYCHTQPNLELNMT